MCSPFLKRPSTSPHSLSKIKVENKEKESRREPPGGFRPQTLPLWEYVGRTAPEQNNQGFPPPFPEERGLLNNEKDQSKERG